MGTQDPSTHSILKVRRTDLAFLEVDTTLVEGILCGITGRVRGGGGTRVWNIYWLPPSGGP